MTLNWTAEQDATITRMHSDGVSLTKAAESLGVHRKTLTNRLRQLGLSRAQIAVPVVWDDAKKSELTRLWDAKWPSRAIAAEMGISKNAVIGEAHRLKLESRERVAKPKAPRKPRHTPHQRNAFDKVFAPFAYVPTEGDVNPRHLQWAEISPGDGLCRQPYGKAAPFTYCGHPVQRSSSYCPVHHAINCVPWRPTANREQVHADRINRFRAYKAELVEA